jgi:hypothetical protein
MRFALVLVVLVSPAVADPKSTVLTMQYIVAENVHLADGRGASNRHDESKVRVELEAGYRATVTDIGFMKQHDLYPGHATDTERRWTHAWTGRWTMTGGGIQLDLALATTACSQTRASTGAARTSEPCPALTKQVQLACTNETFTLEDAARTRQLAWCCMPVGTAELGATRTPWILPKNRCIQVTGGKAGTKYLRCTP